MTPNKFISRLANSIRKFSLTEKVIFSVFFIVLFGASFSALIKVNAEYLVEIPKRGGTIEEGLIGTPRFINPVIAISDTDRDISQLVYSGLLKISSNGELENNLAESYSISDDGLTYSIKIKDNAFFHDGKPVTTDDVIFTIKQTQDPAIKSPKRPNWDGIIIERIDEKNIDFTLSQPYSPFIYNLTLGILPKHIWENISSDEFAFSKFNLEPVGSGPYVIDQVSRDNNGIAKKYVLKSFKNYSLGEPYIEKIVFSFYKNEEELIEAMNEGIVTSAHGITSSKIEKINSKDKNINNIPLSRIFAVFLNQNKSDVLLNKEVRQALDIATPKKQIIDEIFDGYAEVIKSPIPANLLPLESIQNPDLEDDFNLEKARKILENAGWKRNEDGVYTKETEESISTLNFSISTANVEELIRVAEKIESSWEELGAQVDLKIFEPNDLTLNVIRPREFESILFGQVIKRDLDFYGFWHSSQRSDPGLNIASYANIDADASLENARTFSDIKKRNESLQKFENEVINDSPAIFLYSPDFIYIVSKSLKNEIPRNIVTSSDRFADIEKWYTETDMVWRIFADN